MTDKTIDETADRATRRTVDMVIRLLVVGVLGLWCALILAPFFIPVLWAAILAVTVQPIHGRITAAVGGRKKLAAFLLCGSALAVVMVPTGLLTISAVKSGMTVAADIHNDTLVIPPPPEQLAEFPLIGTKLQAAWKLGNESASAALVQWSDEVKGFAAWVVGAAGSLLMQVLMFCASIAIAGVFLAVSTPGREFMQSVGRRLSPAHGDRLVDLITQTIRSVAKGVLGVAATQSLLAGIGLLIAGVPGAGLWAIAVLFVAIIQLPPILILLPVIIWYFSVASTAAASVLAVWLLLVSSADAVLKPMLLGRGLSVPMPVILLGAIGGMLLSGIIGLFVGAVILALGHTLFIEWLNLPTESGEGTSGEGISGEGTAVD